MEEGLIKHLVEISDGFSGADIEAAVRDVVKYAITNGDDAVSEEIIIKYFENTVPLSQTSPEQIEYIRAWGRERAVPAGKSFREEEALPKNKKNARTVLI